MKLRNYIPNALTVLNLVCGLSSIAMILQGNLVMSAVFVFLAAVFDYLDGTAARLLKAHSLIGKELDSLADVVSFGVAPSFLVYMIHLNTMNGLGTLISAMPMAFPTAPDHFASPSSSPDAF